VKLYPTAEKPLIYLSGSSSGREHEIALVKHGCTHRCYSFAYCSKKGFNYASKMKEALEASVDLGVGVMMDSSAASFHGLARKRNVGKHSRDDIDKLRDSVVSEYVGYVKRHRKEWDWYVTFDYDHDADICWNMQKHLEHKGIHPVPVYHSGQDTEWFERYCREGYKLIGIGGTVQRRGYTQTRMVFDRIFDLAAKHGVELHGFGITSLSLMLMYPWYSVDSASWVKIAAYGSVLHVDEERGEVSEMHFTDRNATGKTKYAHMPKALRKEVTKEIEANGFKVKDLRKDSMARCLYNVKVFTSKLHVLKEIVSDGRAKWRSLLT
jgi:hypothetical protein